MQSASGCVGEGIPVLSRAVSGRYRPQEPSIASSPEDTRLAIRQFEFGMRNRTKIQQSQMKTMKSGFFIDYSHRTRSVGATQIAHLELPPKLPPKCSAAPDPPRSLTIISCRPIRVRHPYLSRDFGSIPPLSDRPRTSQISGPAHHRINAENAYFCRLLVNSNIAVTPKVTPQIS